MLKLLININNIVPKWWKTILLPCHFVNIRFLTWTRRRNDELSGRRQHQRRRFRFDAKLKFLQRRRPWRRKVLSTQVVTDIGDEVTKTASVVVDKRHELVVALNYLLMLKLKLMSNYCSIQFKLIFNSSFQQTNMT